jgi:hypothetical protein
MSYKPEVQADSSGTWAGNALRFATKEESDTYVTDLAIRWTLVRDTRSIEVNDPITARIVDNKLEHLR